ncbi:MAG: hypothetical protein AB7S48_09260 [Bacteroidales bacterium]
MLKRFLNTLVALPIAISLILASSGITIFLHHCNCKGKTIFSFYHEVGCRMSHNSQLPLQVYSGFETLQVKSDNRDCGCSNKEISIKLDDITQSTSLNNTIVKTLLIVKIFAIESNNSNLQDTNASNLYAESESPPPKHWGKSILILYNSLKIYHINS